MFLFIKLTLSVSFSNILVSDRTTEYEKENSFSFHINLKLILCGRINIFLPLIGN